MSFQYPDILLSLIFLLVPIILFFIKRPKVKRIRIPTLRFLKKASSSHKKKISFKELIILLLRLLFITAVVFSLSGIFLKDSVLIKKQKTVILIDNSISFTNFYDPAQYKKLIGNKVDELKNKYDIEYIRFVFRKDGELIIRKDISELKPSYYAFEFDDMINKVKDLFEEEVNIIIFSDCQNYDDMLSTENINIIDISKKWKDNVFVSDVEKEPLYFQNRSSTIGFNIRNISSKALNIKATLYLNDSIVSVKETLIKGKATKNISFNIITENIGHNKIGLRLSGDDFPLDNTFHTGVYTHYRFICAYTGEKINPYFKLAFSDNINHSPFIFEKLSRTNIQSIDSVLIFDLPDKKDLSNINRIIEAGKPIFIFANEPPSSFESLTAEGLIPFKIVSEIAGNLKVVGHPILSKFLFWKRLMLDDYKNHIVLFNYDDGSPAVLKYKVGESTIHFFNMFFDKKNTNMTYSPYFVLFWFNTLTEESNGNEFVEQKECSQIYPMPGFYESILNAGNISKDSNNIIKIYVNIPEMEKDFTTYKNGDKVIELKNDIPIKGNIDLTRVFALIAFLLFLLENYLEGRWR